MSSRTDPQHRAEESPRVMTVEEVRGASFQQSPLAWRGYSEQEVDQFVERAAQSLEENQRETVALRAEVDRLRNFYRRHGTEVDHSIDRPANWGGPGERNPLVAEVQRYVQTQVAQADAYAELVTADARPQADEMLLHAQLRSKIIIEDLVRAFLAHRDDQLRANVQLEQLARWVAALADALWAQTNAMTHAVEAELSHQPALEPSHY